MRPLPADVTAGPRAAILECIERCPGVHLRSVERQTSLPLGQVLYHLDRLERMGLVASTRDEGFRRFFATRDVPRGEKPLLMALRHEVPRLVIVALLREPGLAHKDLQALARTAGSTLSFHLQRLASAGLVRRERAGSSARHFVTDPALARRVLIYHRASFNDPVVDRFVRDELAAAFPSGISVHS